MARQRRGGGGGFRPPELKGTLGTLINTALSQAGVVRDVLERGAREGRARLDDVRANRRRHDALAELGEIVLDLIRRGEIDLGELPEARDVLHTLDELDGEDATDDDEVARPPSRRRFDERATAAPPSRARGRGDEDGTVSSRSFSARKPTTPMRVWRPTADEPAPPTDDDAPPAAKSRDVPRRTLPNNPSRKGGIAFDDDDEDLASYMHPDDVPPKTDE